MSVTEKELPDPQVSDPASKSIPASDVATPGDEAAGASLSGPSLSDAPAAPNPCEREVSIEIPADTVSAEFDRVLSKYRKLARLPGFRTGKVPANIIKQRFAEDLKQEVLESLVPRFLREQIEKQSFAVVSQPRVTDLHLKEGEPLRFTARFEVLPEIELKDYDNVRVEQPEITVSDEDVAASLEHLRQQNSTYEPVTDDRSLADGDYAQVAFRGTPRPSDVVSEATENAPATQPVSVDDVLVEIGGANTVKDFSENLRGARAGEERTFDVTYPADFQDARLAGTSMSYAVQIKGIKQKRTPELDDAFAKEMGEFAGIDDLRNRIREDIAHQRRHQVEHAAKEKLLDELIQQNQFPVPEALIDRQVDLRLERGLRALAAQGMRADDMKKMDLPHLRAGQRDAARREVQASLVLDKIAEKENIDASEEEVAREIDTLAAQTKQTPESVRVRLTENGALDRIRDRIRNEKTLSFLIGRPA